MDSPSKITKIKLKRCEKSRSPNVTALSKISCKIGDHLVHAYINSGSSISIASTDLYNKLVADKCTFKDGTATLNLIDESIPNQGYRVTTATVTVIGKSKSINLVTFPDTFTHRTILGMDFLTKKSVPTSKDDAVFRVPEKPAPKSNPIHSIEINDEHQPMSLLDWILDTNNLKKPLYNILADGTADDDDLFAICAFMKRMPRMVSPIRSLGELSSCMEKQIHTELNVASFDKVDRVAIASDCFSSKNASMTPDTSTSLAALSDKTQTKVESSSTSHDTTTLESSIPATIPIESDVSSASKNQTSTLKTLLTTASLDKAEEKVIGTSSKNESKTSERSTIPLDKADEKAISLLSKNLTNTAQAPTSSTTSLDKVKEKAINLSTKNQTTTSRTLASLEKEKEKILSLLKNQTDTARTSAPSVTVLEKAKEKVMSSWSKNQTETSMMSTPSRTSLYKAKDNNRSSSSRNQTTNSRKSTSSAISFDRAKEKGISSSLKNPTKTSIPPILDKAKEKVVRSTNSSNSYRRVMSSKSGRH